jgi:hypothetical protein
MPAISHRCRTASLLVGLLLPAFAATLALAPTAARANDRDLRGTSVPASACVEHSRSASFAGSGWSTDGYFVVSGAGTNLIVRCPLPVNSIDLSGTTNDNDISKIRVHYQDPDGFAFGNDIQIQLIKTTPASPALKTVVCEWRSSVDGTGSTTAASATKACPHDVASGSFYHFNVFIYNGSTKFFGIDFPQ